MEHMPKMFNILYKWKGFVIENNVGWLLLDSGFATKLYALSFALAGDRVSAEHQVVFLSIFLTECCVTWLVKL